MFFFVGWPNVIPLKNSEVVDIQHNASKVWTVILTKDRISLWTFALNDCVLLGFLQRSDIGKYGENHFILWSFDSRKIAVITTKLCVYLYNIEEINEFVLTQNISLLSQQQNNQSKAPNLSTPKIKKIRIIPYKLLHLMKLPPYSTITRACHLTNDIFVISTNYAQFIHIHWKGHVEVKMIKFSIYCKQHTQTLRHIQLTCQLNLKNKAPSNEKEEASITPSVQSHESKSNHCRRGDSLPAIRSNQNDAIGIVDLSMSTKLGIMVVVFESGSCWIIPLQKLSKNVSTHNLSVNQTTYIAEYENVSCCDICDRFHFLALGLSTGNVVIYHLNLEFLESQSNELNNSNNNHISMERKLQFRLELLCIFNAHNYGLIPQTFALDDVREVCWSDSGTSLSICWKKGVAVYSVRGIVVFSTLHHQIHKKNVEKEKDDPLTAYYASCLKWCQKDDGFIFVTHKHAVTKDDFNHYLKQYEAEKRMKNNQKNDQSAMYNCKHNAYLMQIKCLKHTLGNLSQSDVSKLSLLSSDYLSIWRPIYIIDDPESTNYWSRIEIDSHYLTRNWPIRELAVNPRANCFVIAGSTGFAMYFRKFHRWRIVRSLDGENVLFSCVMCWLSNDLLFVATFDPSFRPSVDSHKQSKWNLVCFDRWQIDKHFVNGNSGIPASSEFVPLFEYPLTNHPIGMEAVDKEKLLIYFVDGVIHIYDIQIENHYHSSSPKTSQKLHSIPENQIKKETAISLSNYCVLAPFQTLSPHPVSLRMWNYGHLVHDDAGFCILSLSANRDLYRINPCNNERDLITKHVHDFYLQRETRDKNDKIYLWTYAKECVQRWNVCIDPSDANKLILQSLYVSPVQPHMTCIGICNTLNVLVYGRRIIRKMEPLHSPRFAIHIDIRSYLHVTIKEKLHSIGLEDTFDFVLKAIAGGAWRCLNALEHILRSSLQKRYKQKRKNKKKMANVTPSSASTQVTEGTDGATLPFEQDALLAQQPLRSTYVFFPNDVHRDFSRQNLRQNENENDDENGQENMEKIVQIPSKILHDDESKENENKKNENDEEEDEDEDGVVMNETLMMMNRLSFDENDNDLSVQMMEEKEDEIDVVIKFLRKFPDYPGIVVNVARKTEPCHWNDLFKICGSPRMLIQKSIDRNQLATASKFLYVFEKIHIEDAIHFATMLIELAVSAGAENLVLSLLRFSHKLKLMIKESHDNNIEIPQLRNSIIW